MKPEAQNFQTILPRTYTLPYWLFLPKNYGDETRTWPLLLYLHGASSRGDDIQSVLASGLPAIASSRDDFPFVLVCPQCPADTWWSDQIAGLDILLKDIADRYRIDQKRVLLTGSSMGGFGVWHMGAVFPDRFAGLVPLCGGGAWFYGFPERARSIANTPVWAFHGSEDPIIPVRESAALVKQVQDAGGNAQLEIIEGGGHDIWRQVYQRSDVFQWMLDRQLPERSDR